MRDSDRERSESMERDEKRERRNRVMRVDGGAGRERVVRE